MSVRLRPIEITDPMLLGFHKQKEAAFLEAKKHFNEARLKLAEMDEEIETFKSWVVSVVEKYQSPTELLPPLSVLKGEREGYLKQHREFKEVYVKASAVAYKILETTNYLQPAFRIDSEEKYFDENMHNFYAQMRQSEKICLDRADKLKGMFTDIVHQKSVTLALIEDAELTMALERLRTIVENRNPRPSRASQFLNYLSSYAPALTLREPSPEPVKARDPPKRAALTPLNLAVIPRFNPSAPSLHARVSPSPARPLQRSASHRFPLFSTSGSSPRSLQISSEISTSSPRQEPFFPSKAATDRNRREAPDSWESISLGASEARNSISPRTESPRESRSSYARRIVLTPRETSPARSRRDREISSPRYEVSPRGVSPTYPRDSRISIRDRDALSARRDRDQTSSSHEKSPRQIRVPSKTIPREPRPSYRPSSERRYEPRSPDPIEERRKRHSMKPSIQYKDEKTYR